jgi:hypothetical protein
MQIILGLVLLIISAGMIMAGRPQKGSDSVPWLSKPWILGQAYVMIVLIVGVVGVSFILTGWPS